MLDGMKHIGTVITDFERSLEFYCGTLGMKVSYGPFVAMGAPMPVAFGQRTTGRTVVPFGVDTAAFLRYSDDPGEVVVDFGWWHRPPSEGVPYQRPNNLGHQRLAVRVPSAADSYRELLEHGVRPLSEPVEIRAHTQVKTFCFRDPDGIGVQVIEVPEWVNAQERRVFFVSSTVSDLRSALSFYQEVLGMTVVAAPFEVSGPEIGRLYGLSGYPDAGITAAWLNPGAQSIDPTLVELIQWNRPASAGFPYPRATPAGGSFANHVGIVRQAFNVHDSQVVYDELVARHVNFVSEPQITSVGGPEVGYCCFENYDGTILQLYSAVSGSEGEFKDQLLAQLGGDTTKTASA